MTPEEELRYLILGVQREGNRWLAAQLAPLGLTPAQAEVVGCLAAAGPLSLRGLGERLVCETGSPSRLVDALVDRGVVAREVNGGDRRQVRLALTPAGLALAAEVRRVEAGLQAMIAARLGPQGIAAGLLALRPLAEGSAAAAALARRRGDVPPQ